MTNSDLNDLVRLLACPDCGGDPLFSDGELRCSGCSRSYEVKDGIPLLYPKGMNREHLAEEEKLGGIMQQTEIEPGTEFSEEQWKRSKDEFWGQVRERLGGSGLKIILNVGCGIDTRALELQEMGHTLVSFDLVYSLLESLKTGHGAKHCTAGDLLHLPFKSGSFDCLCCIDLIHHEIEHTPEILATFERVLKPGGLLFLEDINAWGLFQFYKSILLPRPVHRTLRSLYHVLKGSPYRPADYEFPTSVFKTMRLLERVGFAEIDAVPQRAYPNIGGIGYRIYEVLSRVQHIKRYHNYHYMIVAVAPKTAMQR
ncbi:MAG: methyltransferase domain-containing protein [bacterium]|nr:MAG: methyltransferase domain-containing protein [bacterium]